MEFHIADTFTDSDFSLVPRKGIEPPHLAAAGPKPAASTNFATWALPATKSSTSTKLHRSAGLAT